MKPRVLILRTAGTNCDEETAFAWKQAGATADRVHVQRVVESPALLDEYDALTVPGGFSYGDDIAAGKILANQLLHHLADPLAAFIEKRKPVLGICNGFQVLARCGLVPAIKGERAQTITVTNNDSARFEDRWVHMKIATDRCVFLTEDVLLAMPIAHGEGKLICADETVRQHLHADKHVALQYCDEHGKPGPFPINPNGSVDDIAGLTDSTGCVLGLMPHPERHIHPTQRPDWTSRNEQEPTGRVIFRSAVQYLRA